MNTKERILEAFNEIASKSDFESITVFQIVEKAHVSRATFYRHFKDKYDVMNYNYSSLLDYHMRKGHIHTLEDLLYHILEEGRNYWKPLLPLFQSEGVNSLSLFIREYSFAAARNLYEYGNIYGEGKRAKELSEAEKLQLQIFARGAAQCYKDWIEGKYALSSKQAAQAMAQMLPECLRDMHF